MGFDDQWWDAKNDVVSAIGNLAEWLSESEKQAYEDASLVVEYLSAYVDTLVWTVGPTRQCSEDNPVLVAFGEVKEKLHAVAEVIRKRGVEDLIRNRNKEATQDHAND
jgi:hypothetical protein